jgi:hypothetical protein
VNLTTATTGNAGAANPAGITLGAQFNGNRQPRCFRPIWYWRDSLLTQQTIAQHSRTPSYRGWRRATESRYEIHINNAITCAWNVF